jgi:6-phosphogluconolactonase
VLTRRSAAGFALGALTSSLTSRLAWTATRSDTSFLCADGATLIYFAIDSKQAALQMRGTVGLPSAVQYAWPHPRLPLIYAACSHNPPNPALGESSAMFVCAVAVDAGRGSLRLLDAPRPLSTRANHLTVDRAGRHLLMAHPAPSGVSVLRLEADGALGAEVAQPSDLDFGIYAHQVRVMPDDAGVILVTRGNDATASRPEDPGALKIFGVTDGVLANRASIAPGGGIGFGPRHLDFHPTQPWVYVSLERENLLHVYRLRAGSLDASPLFVTTTLANPAAALPGQIAGAVHVHPDGRHVYVANRGNLAVSDQTGESSIAVFRIDAASGAPRRIGSADAQGFHPRTFSLDPAGRLLIAANVREAIVHDGDRASVQPADVVVWRIRADGRLDFARRYDLPTTEDSQLYWSGIVRFAG